MKGHLRGALPAQMHVCTLEGVEQTARVCEPHCSDGKLSTGNHQLICQQGKQNTVLLRTVMVALLWPCWLQVQSKLYTQDVEGKWVVTHLGGRHRYAWCQAFGNVHVDPHQCSCRAWWMTTASADACALQRRQVQCKVGTLSSVVVSPGPSGSLPR